MIVDFHGDGERMQQSKDTVSGSKRPRDDVLGAGAAPAGMNILTVAMKLYTLG